MKYELDISLMLQFEVYWWQFVMAL